MESPTGDWSSLFREEFWADCEVCINPVQTHQAGEGSRVRSGKCSHVALTSLLSLLANVLLHQGSFWLFNVSYKGQLILWGRFWGMPALRTPWSHSRFTIPKDKPKLHLRGTPASLKTNTLRQTKSKLREGRSKAKHARCKTDGNEPQCAALWNMSYLTIQTAALH